MFGALQLALMAARGLVDLLIVTGVIKPGGKTARKAVSACEKRGIRPPKRAV